MKLEPSTTGETATSAREEPVVRGAAVLGSQPQNRGRGLWTYSCPEREPAARCAPAACPVTGGRRMIGAWLLRTA